ncbi:proteasome regulatory subunit C-terminal-domain-containing protein [Dipodascopsis tothii]|uniref:proteasome regulatory subunit C-terminal-domain-containing protein n=1 Tax=Dipodascopsis tothii TaxID=44089 RepID=UPI0034CECC01
MSAETKDEQMMDVDAKASPVERSAEEKATIILSDIKQNFGFLERAAQSFEPRFAVRALRGLGGLRRGLTADILASVVEETYGAPSHKSAAMISEVIERVVSTTDADKAAAVLPEVDIYVLLLVQVFLLDQGAAKAFVGFTDAVVDILRAYNRRTLDSLAAKVWFYYEHAHELDGTFVAIRPKLLAALRTATLRHDAETQAMLTTLLLRNYLKTQSVSQANQLVLKTTFPTTATNSVTARYLYYVGRIKVIQLDYTAANENLIGAIRKAPQTTHAAGFVQAANKLKIIIELLMGDIPERSLFREPVLEKALTPYVDLVKAVRVGDVPQFSETIAKYAAAFKKDETYMLILRLRQNVIKTGIRMMSLSYSKISLRDMCIRLHLDSEESAEYIVAKAIRDDVIEATVDHEKGFMQSKEILDVYSTPEPSVAFHDRIKFCLSLHEESVKAMRYPMNQHRVELKNVEEAREREKELASEIQEGDMEDDDGDFDGL